MQVTKAVMLSGTGIALVVLAWWVFLPQPVQIEVATVTRGTFVKTVDDDGRTRIRERYIISAPLAGRLTRIEHHAGDQIIEGDILTTIQPNIPALLDQRTREELKARAGAAEAAQLRALARVQQATVNLTQARADLERSRQLAPSRLISVAKLEQDTLLVEVRDKELEAAREEEHVAAHESEVAKAALREAVKESGNSGNMPLKAWGVRSPVSGYILRIIQQSEAPIAPGQPIMEIGNPEDLEVVIDVLTTDAVDIRPGAKVWFEHWGSESRVEGRVRTIEPAAFTKLSALGVEEQRVNVIVDVISSTDDWKNVGDGYKVDARIVTRKIDNALMAPSIAFFRDQNAGTNSWFAYRIENGKVLKTAVRIGDRNADESIVLTGLRENDEIVKFPGESLADGVRVRL